MWERKTARTCRAFVACVFPDVLFKASPPAGLCSRPHAAGLHLDSCAERERRLWNSLHHSSIGKPIPNFRGTLFKFSLILFIFFSFLCSLTFKFEWPWGPKRFFQAEQARSKNDKTQTNKQRFYVLSFTQQQRLKLFFFFSLSNHDPASWHFSPVPTFMDGAAFDLWHSRRLLRLERLQLSFVR